MRIRFKHNDYEFEVSAGDPPPCSDDERDRNYEVTLASDDRFPKQPTVHHTTSWIISRLAALTYGDIQALHDGEFHNDGGEFSYRFKVTAAGGELAGKCGVVFFRHRIQFAGFSKAPYDIKNVFTQMLLADPNDLAQCEIHSQDAETNDSMYFGFDGRNLR
ncbi:MAG: hypothetical protein ACYTG0_38730 [Planctomycetota bacterium]|jgi:hypothetical protein